MARVDDKEFEKNVKACYRNTVSTIFRHTGDWDDAEDAVQQACMRAYENLDTFRGDSKFGTWLTRIAINESCNIWVKRQRRVPRNDIPADNAEHYSNMSHEESPELVTEALQIKERLESAAETMPEVHLESYTIREMEGLSYDQIADRLGVPTGTVRSRISRAKTHIKKHLEEAENV
jgi:RNA polymerase sigma-70 factor (ECF subfamily)